MFCFKINVNEKLEHRMKSIGLDSVFFIENIAKINEKIKLHNNCGLIFLVNDIIRKGVLKIQMITYEINLLYSSIAKSITYKTKHYETSTA